MFSFLILLATSLLLFLYLPPLLQRFLDLQSRKKHTFSHGPNSYPIIGCLIAFYRNRHRLLDWYTEILSKSPSQTMVIKRFGAPRTIVTANPQNVEHILKTNFNNYPKGKPFTEILGDFLGRGIFNADGHLWLVQRKLAIHEFTAKSLREFVVKILEEEVQNKLFPLLEKAVEKETVLDLQDVLRRFAFDTICKVTLGMDPCCLDISQPVSPLALAFDKASEICARRGVAPIPLVWKMKRALNLGSEKELKEAVNLVHGCVDDTIRAKKAKLAKSDGQETCESDLLSRLLSAGLDNEMVRDMVISFLMAGRDTTSSALTWLFWLLSNHHDVKKNVLNEMELVLNLDQEKPYLDVEILKEMKYIKACLCESMRLYPPVVWDSKHAEKDDILPDGTIVQKGNRVTYFQYGMGRLEELWGKDWYEFRPERWFDDDDKNDGNLKMVSPYKFPVFQAGPRVCLGKEMAFIQMKYVVASILGRYEIKKVDENHQPVFVPLLTAFMAGGLKVRVHRSSHADSDKMLSNSDRCLN